LLGEEVKEGERVSSWPHCGRKKKLEIGNWKLETRKVAWSERAKGAELQSKSSLQLKEGRPGPPSPMA